MNVDIGILMIRLVLGLILAGHGAQKMFGWFGGGGPEGTAKMMEKLNLEPSHLWGFFSGFNEFAGGLLTAAGLLMPLGPLLLIANMLVAISTVHWQNGFWNTKKGYEYPLMIGLVALALGVTGAGSYALDAVLPFALPEPLTLIVGLAGAVVAWLMIVAIAHRRAGHATRTVSA